MLHWALMFLVVALVAAIFGFGGIASTATGIAQVLFVIAIIMFVVSLFAGFMRRNGARAGRRLVQLLWIRTRHRGLSNLCGARSRRGRMAANYAEARIAADAQEACLSYGLVRGSDRYDRCVQREISYRCPA